MESGKHGSSGRRAVLYRGELSNPAILSNALSPFFNYGKGFFETVLYDRGKLQLWDKHLERMRQTCGNFSIRLDYSEISEEKIYSFLESENLTGHCSRVKILYAPVKDPGRWDTVVIASPYTPPLKDFVLSVHDEVCDTVLNRYKSLNYGYNLHWRDHYNRMEHSDEVLFINRSGHVLEGSYTNILFVKDSTLFYTGKKQNYLQGIMQSRILQLAGTAGLSPEAMEEGIPLEDLKKADEVMLCNSLMQLKRVRKILCGGEVWRWERSVGKSTADGYSERLLNLLAERD